MQPNNHGDACNVDGECASNRCLKEIRQCKGIDEGEKCTPGLYPDTCASKHYCAPDSTSSTGGSCQKVISAGNRCAYANSCELGVYCAGNAIGGFQRCTPPFSYPNGANTTIGPYMCSSANAVIVNPGVVGDLSDALYTCIAPNATQTGTSCDVTNNATVPPGYTCSCSADGTNRLRTVGGMGLGARSSVWKSLYTCMTVRWWKRNAHTHALERTARAHTHAQTRARATHTSLAPHLADCHQHHGRPLPVRPEGHGARAIWQLRVLRVLPLLPSGADGGAGCSAGEEPRAPACR